MITIDPPPVRWNSMPEETVMLISVEQRTGHQQFHSTKVVVKLSKRILLLFSDAMMFT